MSDEALDGVMITMKDRVFFIPKTELRNFRLPDDVASQVMDDLGGDDVEGFAKSAPGGAFKSGGGEFNLVGVKFDPKATRGTAATSSLYSHALTL